MIPCRQLACLSLAFLWGLCIADLTAAYQTPPWVTAYQDGNLVSEDNYLGVGSAGYRHHHPDQRTRRLSKDRALDDLAYQLSVTITSQLAERLSQEGDFSQENISASLFVSTRKVLSGVVVRAKWTDPSQRRHWVLLAIDKQSARHQMQQQHIITEVVNRLENRQAEIDQGVKRVNHLLSKHSQQINRRIEKMEALLKKMSSKLDPSGSDAQTEYRPLIQKLEQVTSQRQQREHLIRDPSGQINALMLQNQALTQQIVELIDRIANDHYLPFLKADIDTQMTHRACRVSITPDKGQNAQYEEGETVRFQVRANRDGFIKVIYTSAVANNRRSEIRKNTLLFPNIYDRNNRIRANQTVVIGRRNELTIMPPFGRDIITVVASTTQFEDIDDLLAASTEPYYAYETRSIEGAVDARGIGVKPKVETITDTCFIVSHPRGQR